MFHDLEGAALKPDFKDQICGGEPTKVSAGQHNHRADLADRIEAFVIELRSTCDASTEVIPADLSFLGIANKVYSARRNVDKIFNMAGFAVSPAWDIMLDLYQARANDRDICVTSASIGAACPATTALRWLQILEDMQLVERRPDCLDKRRMIVRLTESAVIKVEKALSVH